MILGVDFDNTIVCYDGLFHAQAVSRGMIPPDTPAGKTAVRDALRDSGREDAFTLLQGYVYGPGIHAARPYPGVAECLCALRRQGVNVRIVSHKTPFPYLGPRYDLQQFARDWLVEAGLVGGPDGLARDDVFLEATREGKARRIASLGCTHFIDDLPDFLSHPDFPSGVRRLLFAPGHAEGESDGMHCVPDWWSARRFLERELAMEPKAGHNA